MNILVNVLVSVCQRNRNNSLRVCVCVCVSSCAHTCYIHVYYEELAHMIVGAENSHGLSSARKPGEAGGTVPVHI